MLKVEKVVIESPIIFVPSPALVGSISIVTGFTISDGTSSPMIKLE